MNVVDVMALHTQCLRWGVTPHETCTEVSAHRLLGVLPCAEPKLGQMGEVIELRALVRRCFLNVWSVDIGERDHFTGSFENCITRIAQRCVPPAAAARSA